MSIETKTQSRYAKTFEQLKAAKKTALIPFTLLGWPNEEQSFEIIKSMIDSGASALELGLAFSDPMADGPVIQQACTEVLQNNFGTQKSLQLLKKVRQYNASIPIGLLVYYNMVLSYGIERWFQALANAGVDACMIVDLPIESIDEIQQAAIQSSISLVLMISPITSKSRIEEIAKLNPAFFYVVSRLGITGTHTQYDDQLQTLLDTIRSISDIPCCVGFGISKPEQVEQMKALGADGVIIGSAIIQTVKSAQQNANLTINKAVQEYLSPLITSCK